MTERTCATCVWREREPADSPFEATCHYSGPKATKFAKGLVLFPPVRNVSWCRHWSETTGWDRFEQMPTQLERAAFEIFQRIWGPSGSGPAPKDVQTWLEEYKRRC